MYDADLEKSKELIDQYCRCEFGSGADFSDLSNIGVAYTTTEDEGDEIQVCVDLISCAITQYVNGEVRWRVQHRSLSDLINNDLRWLDFDSLVSEWYGVK